MPEWTASDHRRGDGEPRRGEAHVADRMCNQAVPAVAVPGVEVPAVEVPGVEDAVEDLCGGHAVIVTDPRGVVCAWNQAAERLYGWSASDAIGRSIVELTPTDHSASEAAEILTTLAAGLAYSGDFEVRHRDGRVFTARVTDIPVLDAAGKVVGIVGVSDEVPPQPSRAAAGDAVSGHAAQDAGGVGGVPFATALLSLARDALGTGDLDGLLGRAAALVVSHLDVTRCEILLRAGDDGQLRRAAIADAAAGAAAPDGLGTAVWLGDDEGPLGVLGVLASSPSGLAEAELEVLDGMAGMLAAALRRHDRERDLGARTQGLLEHDAQRLTFLRATSHELRTPLAALVGFSDLLHRYDDRISGSERQVLLERLNANATRLGRLLDDLLDLDRLSHGLQRAERRPEGLSALITRVVGESSHGGARVVCDLESVVALVDAAKIERVVSNLVANAVRHCAAGGEVRVVLRRRFDKVVLQVDNTGAVIEPAELERIFEPFVQGAGRERHAEPGSGLGLTLVRELVALHGGTVVAQNRPDGVVRFEVVLPGAVVVPAPPA